MPGRDDEPRIAQGGAAVVHDGLVVGRLHHGDEGFARGVFNDQHFVPGFSGRRDEGMVGIGQPDHAAAHSGQQGRDRFGILGIGLAPGAAAVSSSKVGD